MKTIHSWRHDFGDQGNVSLAFVYGDDGGLLDYFLFAEDPWLDNQADISCLPPGPNSGSVSYLSKWIPNTPKHPDGVYQLQNTGARVGCEMHSGNFFGNKAKGFKSDVEGCLLVAETTGMLSGQIAVLNSTVALARFNTLMNKEDFNLVIHGATV